MALVSPEGRFLEVNRAFGEITGYTGAELLATDFQSITHPEDLPESLRALRQLVAGEIPGLVLEKRYVRKDGGIVWVQNSIALARDGAGQPEIFVTLAQDVTLRKRAEQALIEKEKGHLDRRIVHLQEEERRAIARELHDEVGQLLTGLGLMIEAGEGPGSAGRRLEMKRVVTELIERVRDLSMKLRPPMLDELGLLPTLLWQIERFELQTGVHVDLRHANLDRRFPSEIEITTFHTVQEALTNVARHAGVAKARVEVWAGPKGLGARIEDEGRGFNVEAVLAGHSSGLAGMRERCRLLGGQVAIESAPGTGTRLSIDLPWSESPANGSGK